MGWYPAPEREHRGFDLIPYAPEGEATWWNDTGEATTTFDPTDSPYHDYFPIPYNFDYQVTVYSRFMHEHTMPIVSTLANYDRLHPKFAFLDIPQDGTKRTLQVIGGPDLQTGKDSNGKRIFWVDYIVRVFSELVPPITQSPIATSLNFDLSVYINQDDMSIVELEQAHGLFSVGSSVGWNLAQS